MRSNELTQNLNMKIRKPLDDLVEWKGYCRNFWEERTIHSPVCSLV